MQLKPYKSIRMNPEDKINTIQTAISLPIDTYGRLYDLSDQTQVTMNWIIRRAIKYFLMPPQKAVH